VTNVQEIPHKYRTYEMVVGLLSVAPVIEELEAILGSRNYDRLIFQDFELHDREFIKEAEVKSRGASPCTVRQQKTVTAKSTNPESVPQSQ